MLKENGSEFDIDIQEPMFEQCTIQESTTKEIEKHEKRLIEVALRKKN